MKYFNNENVFEQLSLFDLPTPVKVAADKNIIKKVIFAPKEKWESNLFKEFEPGKEYSVIKAYVNRTGVEFYILAETKTECWSKLFQEREKA